VVVEWWWRLYRRSTKREISSQGEAWAGELSGDTKKGGRVQVDGEDGRGQKWERRIGSRARRQRHGHGKNGDKVIEGCARVNGGRNEIRMSYGRGEDDGSATERDLVLAIGLSVDAKQMWIMD